MTYSLHITPYQAALLDGAARSAGLSLPLMLAMRAARITAPGGAVQGSTTPPAGAAPAAPTAPAPAPAPTTPAAELDLTC